MPKITGGDSMVLQYLIGVQIENEDLTIISDIATELLKCIRETIHIIPDKKEY